MAEHPNLGQVKFAAVKADRGLTQVELAAALECSQAYISDLLAGRAVPNLRVATRCQERFGVEASDWLKVCPSEPSASGEEPS